MNAPACQVWAMSTPGAIAGTHLLGIVIVFGVVLNQVARKEETTIEELTELLVTH